jgi:hypothetical protein
VIINRVIAIKPHCKPIRMYVFRIRATGFHPSPFSLSSFLCFEKNVYIAGMTKSVSTSEKNNPPMLG